MKINSQYIRKLIAIRGWTQVNLAETAGISRQSVCTILNRGSCSIKNAKRLAQALGVEIEDIWKGD